MILLGAQIQKEIIDKQVIDKIKQHREDYPDDDNSYVASDGMIFNEKGKLNAYRYARDIPFFNVFIVPRVIDLDVWYNETFAPVDHGSGSKPFKMTFWVKVKLIWRYIFKTKK